MIWHPSFYATPPGDHSGSSVVTVYDMISEKFAMFDPAFQDATTWKHRMLYRANSLLCISESTASDVRRLCRDVPGDIAVMALGGEHLPTSDIRADNLRPNSDAKNRRCLFVGSRTGYKNFELILKAISRPDWPANWSVDVVGKTPSAHEDRVVDYYAVRDKLRFLGRLSESELSQQFQCCDTFAFPSLGEGFGLPTLEAQHAGCVPLLTDIEVFREVGGDASEYFTANDPASFNAALRRLDDDDYRLRLRQKGVANAKRFSWDAAAEVVAGHYHQLWSGKIATRCSRAA